MKIESSAVALAVEIGKILVMSSHSVTVVESCTGGGLGYAITSVPGSSAWFEQGFVTYSNAAKTQLVGVDQKLLDQHGAVSEQVAQAMAIGGLASAGSTYAMSITGIAGPEGGTKEKPIGTVCFGWAGPENIADTQTLNFTGDRAAIRSKSIVHSLERLLEVVS